MAWIFSALVALVADVGAIEALLLPFAVYFGAGDYFSVAARRKHHKMSTVYEMTSLGSVLGLTTLSGALGYFAIWPIYQRLDGVRHFLSPETIEGLGFLGALYGFLLSVYLVGYISAFCSVIAWQRAVTRALGGSAGDAILLGNAARSSDHPLNYWSGEDLEAAAAWFELANDIRRRGRVKGAVAFPGK
jgi:hypothetical protein